MKPTVGEFNHWYVDFSAILMDNWVIKSNEEANMKTLGQNIATFRKEKNITQEALAEICGVSSQAVSKWENDISCPDITLLKTIARTFGISVDELMDDGEGPVTRLSEQTSTSNKMLRIRVLSADGDKVNVNLPLALIELFLSNEGIASGISFGGNMDEAFKKIDFKQIYNLVSLGVMGKLVEVNSADGDIVEVWVE